MKMLRYIIVDDLIVGTLKNDIYENLNKEKVVLLDVKFTSYLVNKPFNIVIELNSPKENTEYKFNKAIKTINTELINKIKESEPIYH